MPAAHFTLTLNGNVQKLSSALPPNLVGKSFYVAWLQPDGGNTNVIYVGGTNVDVAAANYGFRLEAPIATIPSAPWNVGEMAYGKLFLNDMAVKGTNGEKLHLFVVPND